MRVFLQATEKQSIKELNMNVRRLMIMTFTDRGYELGADISNSMNGTDCIKIRVERIAAGALYEKTSYAWKNGYDLLFISAVGIAVRAISGLIDNKLSDRAVIVTDENGRYVIPILSGHVGGADILARYIAGCTGGEVVITSASDIRGVPAFDEWAAHNNFSILNKVLIAPIYDRVLSGRIIRLLCIDHEGEVPFEKCNRRIIDAGSNLVNACDDTPDVIIYGGIDMSIIPGLIREYSAGSLIMAARNLIVGVGCKRGTCEDKIMARIRTVCDEHGFDTRLIGTLATIDLKADEEGIRSVCANNRWKLETYTAEQLREVKGDFDSSEFVEKTVGVDNVCERAAVRAGGRLLIPKSIYDGVTVAVAVCDRL
ncbi:MAG: cobalamin biosynthesis protein [Lachnospiraceae bacterium]|nr:cobalamin biosynthesis protein [Lachnospiraceae bacterium]